MKGLVYNNSDLAGTIEKDDVGQYLFRYTDAYFDNLQLPAISLSFPKTQQEYRAETIFPFFYGLLSEGINKDIQCRLLKLDESDDFTRLLLTAGYDTIGAITIKPATDELPGML
ncbi:MAG: HipA N-terminal domain-containing protein [Ferruginibacter sp.]